MKSKQEDNRIDFLSNRFGQFPLTPGKTVELDLGCGEGSFAVLLAERFPERLVLAADVMLGRLRKLCRKMTRRGVVNITPLRGEAWQLVGGLLPDASIDRLHILCPDPWPKDRHRWHRLVSSEFVGQLGRTVKPGGVLHVATDDVPYFTDAVRVIELSGLFGRDDSQISDLAGLASDFERRFQTEGITVNHAAWRRS